MPPPPLPRPAPGAEAAARSDGTAPQAAPRPGRRPGSRVGLPVVCLALLAVLLASVVVAIGLGAAAVPPAETARYLWAALTGGRIAADEATTYQIVWQIRTPRVLLAALVGAGLSAVGVAIQAMVRNALADPFVLGVSSGASVGAVGVTVTGGLAGLGVYMHTESCYNYPGHPERVTPFEALYTDLERLGRIFGVEAIAAEDVIIKTAGGRNVFDGLDQRWTTVSWEAVAQAGPEVLIILDYGDRPAAKKIEFLRTSPHTRHLPAVRKNNFFVLDYNEGISGPRVIDGTEKFAKYLRTLRR
nr:hypothetical protein GCM10010200_098500 [Actinomadura rugatobispora]